MIFFILTAIFSVLVACHENPAIAPNTLPQPTPTVPGMKTTSGANIQPPNNGVTGGAATTTGTQNITTTSYMTEQNNPTIVQTVSSPHPKNQNKMLNDSLNTIPVPTPVKKTYSILALGDSYTIGESVPASDRYPNQVAKKLIDEGYSISSPKIIARTGWTTSELANAIANTSDTSKYDIVFLLIGVNNQYRGYPVSGYYPEFSNLLTTALGYASGNKKNVYVISIPDYGYTPFGNTNKAAISAGIDAYNHANKFISTSAGVNYIYITDISRSSETGLVAADGLHPSGKQYGYWADKIVAELSKNLPKP